MDNDGNGLLALAGRYNTLWKVLPMRERLKIDKGMADTLVAHAILDLLASGKRHVEPFLTWTCPPKLFSIGLEKLVKDTSNPDAFTPFLFGVSCAAAGFSLAGFPAFF